MTRETKIGLLVGLAFIIVIGILLSDHLTSATEPQQATLVQVAGNVRTGVTVPGESAANPLITTVPPQQQAPVTPQQQVPLKQELNPPKPPVEIVQIGVQPQPVQPQQVQPAPQPPIVLAPAAPPVVTNADPAAQEHPVTASGAATGQTPAAPNQSLVSVAESMGEEVVTLNGQKVEPTPTRLAVVAPVPGSRKHKAEAGDSVSRMAAKFLGGDTRTNRDAIIAANPALQQDANLVIVGRTYVIPPAPQAPATSAPQPTQISSIPTPMPPPAPNITEVPVAPSAPEHFYIVKAGDTLTRIAVEQLGSAGGVPALMDLNKDILKGRDIIRPSMKLRLPAKPLASAE